MFCSADGQVLHVSCPCAGTKMPALTFTTTRVGKRLQGQQSSHHAAPGVTLAPTGSLLWWKISTCVNSQHQPLSCSRNRHKLAGCPDNWHSSLRKPLRVLWLMAGSRNSPNEHFCSTMHGHRALEM